MFSAEIRVHFHFQSEGGNLCLYALLSFYKPSSCAHTLWKASDLVHDIFFLYPRNLDIIKYNKLRGHIFMTNFMILPSPPFIKINNRAIA